MLDEGIRVGVLQGSTSQNAGAEIFLVLSTDKPISAFQFRPRVLDLEDATFAVSAADRRLPLDFAKTSEDRKTVIIVPFIGSGERIGPVEEVRALKLQIIPPEGTPPGTYGMVLEDVRFGVPADLYAHVPLTWASEIWLSAPESHQVKAPAKKESPRFSPIIGPGRKGTEESALGVSYTLVGPGNLPIGEKEFSVAFFIRSVTPVVAFQAALDFNECILALDRVEKVLRVAGEEPERFEVSVGPHESYRFPSSWEEGYAALHVTLNQSSEVFWEPGKSYEVARLHFRLLRENFRFKGRTKLRFRPVGQGKEFTNLVRLGNKEYLPGLLKDLSISIAGPSPPAAESAEEARISLRFADCHAMPGEKGIPLDLYMDTNTAVNAYSVAFRYDARVMEVESLKSLANINGEEPDVCDTDVKRPPSSDGQGICTLCVVMDLKASDLYYPNSYEPIARALLSIRRDAKPGVKAAVRFARKGVGTPPVKNCVILRGFPITPELVDGEVRVTGPAKTKKKVLEQ